MSATAPDDHASPRPVVLGVDGRQGRWCGALLHPDGWVGYLDLADAAAVRHAADSTGAAVVGIDVPIGLPETGQLAGDQHGISIQAWCLRHAMASGAQLAQDPRVVEVHPEVSFLAMTGSVLASKKTPRGRADRLAALEEALPGLDVSAVPLHDDAVDALACAWTARRWAAGTAEVLGGDPDATGRPMRIVS